MDEREQIEDAGGVAVEPERLDACRDFDVVGAGTAGDLALLLELLGRERHLVALGVPQVLFVLSEVQLFFLGGHARDDSRSIRAPTRLR